MGSRVFNFRERSISVKIAGNDFDFEYGDETKGELDGFAEKVKKIAAEVAEGKKTNADILAICAETLDALLGFGANERIFSERKASVADYTDIFVFLADEVNDANKATLDRATRRAKSK